jgi:mRNA interferase YafQ
MRTIKYTNAFKRDYKREKAGKSRQYAEKLDRELTEAVALLADDASLPRRYADHPLTGDWKDFRDCHIRPDLILIYRKPDAGSLELVRLGSHSELGL